MTALRICSGLFALFANLIAASTPQVCLDDLMRLNASFYDGVPVDTIEEAAQRAGIGHCEDFNVLLPFLKGDLLEGGRVLEVGGGTGRAIPWINKNFPGASITVIEHSTKNIEELSRRFGQQIKAGNLQLIKDSIANLNDVVNVDAATWMFSGISEVPPADREAALLSIFKALRPGGHLYIDLAPSIPAVTTDSISTNHDHVTLNKGAHALVLKNPTADDLIRLAIKQGFRFEEKIEYETQSANGKKVRSILRLLK